MPAWPGGPCPRCGEDMPPNMVHCRDCRLLLNPDLESDSVEVPGFEPLKELDSMIETNPEGFYVACPHCDQDLKVADKYRGERVHCKFCNGELLLDLSRPEFANYTLYGMCGHCNEQLRFARKYLDMQVACRYCHGKLHIVRPRSTN